MIKSSSSDSSRSSGSSSSSNNRMVQYDIFELSGCKFLYANLPETEIWTGASNNRIWHRWHNSVPKSQIIFPYVHIDISLVHRFSHCRRTSQ